MLVYIAATSEGSSPLCRGGVSRKAGKAGHTLIFAVGDWNPARRWAGGVY